MIFCLKVACGHARDARESRLLELGVRRMRREPGGDHLRHARRIRRSEDRANIIRGANVVKHQVDGERPQLSRLALIRLGLPHRIHIPVPVSRRIDRSLTQ